MSEDLQNEIAVINSIYGDESLVSTENGNVHILHLPKQVASIRLRFPLEYPVKPPIVLGTESSGHHARKGEGSNIVELFRCVLRSLFRPGEVCMFDVIEEIQIRLEATSVAAVNQEEQGEKRSATERKELAIFPQSKQQTEGIPPPWTLSEVVTELKSVFVARCAPVSSSDQATDYLQHLLESDRRIRSATHNITAWRILGENGVTFQDCDDVGETAAGGRILHLMQLMDVWDVIVVVTRWYGGHQLGPKRFSIINTVARGALVKGGFVKEQKSTKKKPKH